MEADKRFDEEATPWVEQVGLHPRAYLYHNFLTPSERAHLVRLAAPKLRRSTVVGHGGAGVVDDIRTRLAVLPRAAFPKRRQGLATAHALPWYRRKRLTESSSNCLLSFRSYGMFIRRLADPVVARIERRISLWTQLPVENQEDIQASMRS